MICQMGQERYKEISAKCQEVDMQLSQALSLRRQYIKHLNPKTQMTALGLGKSTDIRISAAKFESVVADYLRKCGVEFLSERQQKRSIPKGQPHPPSPDFMFPAPTLLHSAVPRQNDDSKPPQVQEIVIHWLEVKMFYGASCIAVDSASAVGTVLATAQKYVNLYGGGAMVFMYGCGEKMAELLWERGVLALDASPLDVSRVEKHQRTWCANKNGLILP